jgi:hypothetical protein
MHRHPVGGEAVTERRPDPYLMRTMRGIMSARRVLAVEVDHEIEPKLISGDGPSGDPIDKGRGRLGARLEARLNSLHGMWARGYMD